MCVTAAWEANECQQTRARGPTPYFTVEKLRLREKKALARAVEAWFPSAGMHQSCKGAMRNLP